MISNSYMITSSEARWSNYKGFSVLNKVDAINTLDEGIEEAESRGFSVQFKKRDYERHFNYCKGAFGCFLSHYLIWSKILREFKKSNKNQWSLILEDDVDPDDLARFMDSAKTINFQEGVLLNLRFGPSAWGSEAYVIDSYSAGKIIKKCNRKITAPVDKFLFDWREKKPWKVIHESKIHLADWAEQSSLGENIQRL